MNRRLSLNLCEKISCFAPFRVCLTNKTTAVLLLRCVKPYLLIAPTAAIIYENAPLKKKEALILFIQIDIFKTALLKHDN